MITKVNHEIRKRIELDIESFVVADVLNQMKRPVFLTEIAIELAMSMETVHPILMELVERGFADIGKRSNKFSTTSLWKNSVKEPKKEKDVDPAIYLMSQVLVDKEKLRVNDLSDYVWSPREAQLAGELADKLRYSYKVKNGEDADPQQVAHSFAKLLDYLPVWHVKNFSLSRVVNDYNGIISTIKSKSRPADSGDELANALRGI